MSKSIKGTQTEVNLLKSFAGESQARNRYTYFSKVAKDEGYIQISQVFEITANQEKAHAKRFFSYLEGGMVSITEPFPAGVIASTIDNLQAAMDGEKLEYSTLYPNFAEIAKDEGFREIANLWTNVSIAETLHHARYAELLEHLKKEMTFSREVEMHWYCINCGYNTKSKKAPDKCPSCLHPQAYFEILCQNW